MDALLRDIGYTVRVCVRTPGFTAVAVLALALGIGANKAIFTIVNALLLERLPFRDPDRIVALWEESSRRPGRNNVVVTVRTATAPLSLAPAVAQAIRTLDKDQPVSDVRTMNQWVAKSLAQARFSSTLLATFAALALLLAAIGIYGVMSYAVSQRTSEIGIRLALGAETGQILRMIVVGAMRLAAFGLAIGIVLALALGRTITKLLYETGTDPVTFASSVLVLGAVAILASYLPARRASRIAPVDALRYQ
jgi:putative ABC transport system permease protein